MDDGLGYECMDHTYLSNVKFESVWPIVSAFAAPQESWLEKEDLNMNLNILLFYFKTIQS